MFEAKKVNVAAAIVFGCLLAIILLPSAWGQSMTTANTSGGCPAFTQTNGTVAMQCAMAGAMAGVDPANPSLVWKTTYRQFNRDVVTHTGIFGTYIPDGSAPLSVFWGYPNGSGTVTYAEEGGTPPIASERCVFTGATETTVASPFTVTSLAAQAGDGLPWIAAETLVQQWDTASGNVKQSYAVADPATIASAPGTGFGVQLDVGYPNQDTTLALLNQNQGTATVTVTLYNGYNNAANWTYRQTQIIASAKVSVPPGASISKTISALFGDDTAYKQFLASTPVWGNTGGGPGTEALITISSDTPINVGVEHIDINPDGTLVYTPTFAFPLAFPADPDSVFVGSFAQVGSGGGLSTTFTLTNTNTTLPATATLSFFGADGKPMALPLAFLETGVTAAVQTTAVVNRSIPAGGILVIQVPNVGPTPTVGSAVLTTSTGHVGGSVVFHIDPGAQEAVVPLETRNAPSYILPFDNTGSVSTAVAVANLGSTAATVNMIVRAESGGYLGVGTITLPAGGHQAWYLTQNLPATVGIRGTVEFDTPQGGRISVLGMRSAGATWTTVPVL